MIKNPLTVSFTLNGERKTFITTPNSRIRPNPAPNSRATASMAALAILAGVTLLPSIPQCGGLYYCVPM